MLSRKATLESHGQDSSYFMGWEEYEKNPYHDIDNPTGIIQMGLAENQLSFDIIESWLSNNPSAVGLEENGKSIFRKLALFQDYHALPALKKVLANFMGEIGGNKIRFDPSKIVMMAGSTSANETLMFCLAERGEAFLVPTPYYPGFDRDLKWRTDVQIIPIHTSSTNQFKITKPALEQAYQHAQKLKIKVKGVLITNPSNPLGTTKTLEELNHLIDFSIDKNVHIVSDEIYSGTVFQNPSFISIIEAVKNRKTENADLWNRVHIVYSLSKDLGLPGFRVGMVYSSNLKVVETATKMSSFGLVSSQTQYLLSHLLADQNFIESYLCINKMRIKRRKDMLVAGLLSTGLKCLRSNSGLFCWVNMRHLLSSDTFKAEMELWKRILYEVRINISPGSSFHCTEPGWFRVCFANLSHEALDLALERIKAFVDSMGQTIITNMQTEI